MDVTGRMGQVLAKEIDSFPNLLLACGFDINDDGKNTFPVYSNIDDIKEKPDVIVDFSVPCATFNILKYAVKENVPIVIATTGFTKEQLDEIKEISTSIPVFQSSNMSFDINLMKKVVAEVAKNLKGTDIEIVETHHNRKVDAPSGTAVLLADAINEVMDEKLEYNFNRHDIHEKRNPNEIGFSSIRGGNIVGEHSVMFFGEHETFEIKHTSYSRDVFAEGALKACEFIVSQPAGLYGMDDMVK